MLSVPAIDYSEELNVVAVLLKYYNGGFSYETFMKMKFSDLLPWYNRYILIETEREIFEKMSYDSKGKSITPPPPARIRSLALSKIEERKNGA